MGHLCNIYVACSRIQVSATTRTGLGCRSKRARDLSTQARVDSQCQPASVKSSSVRLHHTLSHPLRPRPRPPSVRIEREKASSAHVVISRASKILVETRYISHDVPATFVETDVASEQYNNGQPVLKTVTYRTNASDPNSKM